MHIINGLGNGGAEKVLYNLCKTDNLNKHYVISLTSKGKYYELLISSGIKVEIINLKKNPLRWLSSMYKFFYLIKKINPDLVQTWMPYSDLIGGVIARLSGVKNIYWGVHFSNVVLLPFKTKLVVKICSKLSYFLPVRIICCAESSRFTLGIEGYDKSKLKVINNGYDDLYNNIDGETLVESDLLPSITKSVILGSVTRWNIYKDIPNLLKSLKVLVDFNLDFKCILVGHRMDRDNLSLLELLNEYNLEEYVILLGERSDIPVILRTIDIFILSSESEAFPNVVVESMLCGTPCVATNVGDIKKIIDQYGWIAPPSNSLELSAKIMLAVSDMKNKKQWIVRKRNCRSWAKNNFSINNMVNSYNKVWNL